MCGVAGIYAYRGAAFQVDRAELRRIRDHMARRGPDAKGEWYSQDGRVALGHRRLSIIDLSDRGQQPMSTPDGGFTISFNGEIYNYRTLRAELESQGTVFRSDSDTEVLLHLYAHRGERMFDDLRGMYAFALWDAHRKAVLLARDPFGIKPLYYADTGKVFCFASQVKALRDNPMVSAQRDPAGVAGFYLFGSVPEPYTLYRDIHILPAGSRMWIDGNGARAPEAHFSVARLYRDALEDPLPIPASERAFHARDALLDSVSAHLVSDVPVGAFLSAGVDSGSLVGLMRDAGQTEIRTVTLAFEEYRGTENDESLLASEVARRYGTTHTTRHLSLREFETDLSQILQAMDLPSIDGVNTWFVSKIAREQGLKVAISGLGGDELFGGYPSFRDLPRWTRRLKWTAHLALLGRASRRLGQALRGKVVNPKALGMLEYGNSWAGAYLLRRGLFMPWELPALMGAQEAEEGLARLQPLQHIDRVLDPDPGTDHGRVASLESCLYMRNQLLRDADWAAMAHSLEVRVPLVDPVLLRRLSRLNVAWEQGLGKRLLAATPASALPASVIGRAKTGFTLPFCAWLQNARAFQEWRRVPLLSQPRCHWARRMAYNVHQLAA